MLLNAGADINDRAKFPKDATPLLISINDNNKNDPAEFVDKLIDLGSDVNAADAHGQTPLLRASMFGYTKTVDILLASGACPNFAEHQFGATPLFLCASFSNVECVKALVKAGAEVNVRIHKRIKTGGTPLVSAIMNNCIDCVASLLQAGAAVNYADTSGMTPCKAIQSIENIEIQRAILFAGCGS